MIDCFIGEMAGRVVTGEQVAKRCVEWLMVKVGGHREQVAYVAQNQDFYFIFQSQVKVKNSEMILYPLSVRLYQ